MIQRIQSVYLLLVTGLLIATMCLPMGLFFGADGTTPFVFKPLGISLAQGEFQSTWGLFGILLLSTVCALCTLFLFKNRMLQMRMTNFNSLLLIGYYIVFFVFVYMIQKNEEIMSFQVGWALCLPAVCIILNYLTFRAILRDDVKVKMMDRLRP